MSKWLISIMENKERIKKWLIVISAIFLILGAVSLFLYYEVEKKYTDRIYPGIFIGNIDLSGLSHEQAFMLLNQRIDQIKFEGIPFSYQNNKTTIFPLVTSDSPELTLNVISFNAAKNVDETFGHGRDSSFFSRLKERINLTLRKKYYLAETTLNELEIEKFLKENFSKFENPGTDARLVYKDGLFEIEQERNGQHLTITKSINELKDKLSKLDNSEITLYSETDIPKILKIDCINMENEALSIASRTPFSLFYKDEKWEITKDILANWLTLKIQPRFSILKDNIIIGLDYNKVTEYLNSEITPKINIEPTEPRFEVKNGKVVEFQGSNDGLEVNIEETIKKIEYELLEGCLAGKERDCGDDSNLIELATHEIKSSIQTDEVNNLGIKEIIGTGHSIFTGSPSNRRHNIAVGAAAVNGILVKPNEEFSLMKTLGKIDAESGYLTELVIKDNKTIPEYGGGLCQIGTTVFRATIDSGLPVTARRNHSYRVSYYEPAGTDATIYDPWPDYKFLNDSPYNILIQSRIEGDNLYFDFWSTEDGRKSTSSYPTIYNIVKPNPTRIVETTDLKPGVKKCTERAHNGADAYFDYTVTYPNGEEKKERFSSHYVPWQEVCLVGVEKVIASSSDEIIPTTPDTSTVE